MGVIDTSNRIGCFLDAVANSQYEIILTSEDYIFVRLRESTILVMLQIRILGSSRE